MTNHDPRAGRPGECPACLVTPAAPAEGLDEALETHPWVWDTLPGDVQDAINALRRPVLKEWASPAVARRAEIARNAELRRAAMAYLAHNSGQMLEWAATEDRLREDLRAALERTDR